MPELPLAVITPAKHTAVPSQGATEGRTDANLDHVGKPRHRHRSKGVCRRTVPELSHIVETRACHGARGLNEACVARIAVTSHTYRDWRGADSPRAALSCGAVVATATAVGGRPEVHTGARAHPRVWPAGRIAYAVKTKLPHRTGPTTGTTMCAVCGGVPASTGTVGGRRAWAVAGPRDADGSSAAPDTAGTAVGVARLEVDAGAFARVEPTCAGTAAGGTGTRSSGARLAGKASYGAVVRFIA